MFNAKRWFISVALMELFVVRGGTALDKLFLHSHHDTAYAKAITPILRGNTDDCFMMKCLQQRRLEALWEDFGSFLTIKGRLRADSQRL